MDVNKLNPDQVEFFQPTKEDCLFYLHVRVYPFTRYIHVVVQFYPWFKFYFPLFLSNV